MQKEKFDTGSNKLLETRKSYLIVHLLTDSNHCYHMKAFYVVFMYFGLFRVF